MVNLLFPITSLTPEIKAFFDKTKKRTDINFLVGVTEDYKDKFRVVSTNKKTKIYVFQKGSKKTAPPRSPSRVKNA
jgi:hypothetical protein